MRLLLDKSTWLNRNCLPKSGILANLVFASRRPIILIMEQDSIFRFLFAALILTVYVPLVNGQKPWSSWVFESQRAALQPNHWIDSSIVDGTPRLVIQGNGEKIVNGRWERHFGVEGMDFLRISISYQIEHVEDPHRSVLAAFVWRDGAGKQIGPKEFPGKKRQEVAQGRIIEQSYSVPEGAQSIEMSLIYRWDEDGTVYFSQPKLEKLSSLPKRIVKLAAVHHKPKRSDTQQNLEAFGRLISEAGQRGADIVCLGEGITMVGTGLDYMAVAETVPGPTTEYLGRIAAEYNMYIVAGVLEKKEHIVFNTAVLIDRDGNLAGKYRKVCLPREEIEGGVSPGNTFPVFETDFGTIGLMICWDVAFPEPARALAMQGAEIILMPIWGGNLNLAKARAIENQIYLVSSTYDPDMRTGVFDLEGNLICEGTDEAPVAMSEVDLNKQINWPWLGEYKNRIPQEMPPKKLLTERFRQ